MRNPFKPIFTRLLSSFFVHTGWIGALALLAGGLALFIWLTSKWVDGMQGHVINWWNTIQDPTERGCAYIATAIAAHAVVMAFKTFSPEPTSSTSPTSNSNDHDQPTENRS